MTTALRVLSALFDVETGAATKKLESFDKTLTTVKQGLTTIAATALGAFSLHAVSEFIEQQIDLGSKLNDTAEKLGVSTDALQKFQFAAGLAGVDSEAAASALGLLNRNLGDAISGSAEQAKTFAELGVSLEDIKNGTKNASDLLPGLADSFAAMGSDAERTAAAMKLFGKSGANLLPLLKQGSGELAKMAEQFDALGLSIDEDFIEKADEAGDQLDILKAGFRSLKTRIAVEFLPVITDTAKKFQGWIGWIIRLTRETNIVKAGMVALGAAASAAAAKTAFSWLKVLGLFKPKPGGLLKNLFALGQIGIIVGALFLIAVAIEDIVTMCKGGQSVIGDFVEKMLGVGEKKALIDSLNQAWAAMVPTLKELGPLAASIGKAFADALPYIIAGVVDAIKVVMTLASAISTVGSTIAKLAKGDTEGASMRMLKGQGDVENLWKTGSTTAKLLAAPPRVAATEMRTSPEHVPNRGLQTGDIHIEVNGGPTNADTGRAVAAGVEKGLSRTELQSAANALYRGGQ